MTGGGTTRLRVQAPPPVPAPPPVQVPPPVPGDGLAVVLGGGISGLAAARALAAAGAPFVLIERCPTVGGLTRTVEVGDYCFDYTGHFLHLSRYATPAAIPYAGLRDEEWQTVERRSCCWVGGRFITAPIQYHLGELPPALLAACVASYEQRPSPGGGAASFRDYLVSGFGQVLADEFLIPQNEKTMAIDMGRLSRAAVRRFFPAPDDGLIRAGIGAGIGAGTGVGTGAGTGGGAPGEAAGRRGYNARFWYPRQGGIGRLVDGLASGLAAHTVHEPAVELDLEGRTVRTASGRLFRWSRLFSSLPLDDLCRMSGDPALREAASRLSHSSTVSYNFGLRGALPPALRDLHWIYVPDRALPFYRVGFYSNIGAGAAAPGTSSMYVEVGASPGELDRLDLAGALQARVIEGLSRLGWLDPSQIACTTVHTLRHAYVHHTEERDATVGAIFARLAGAGASPIGRYGQWDYTSMEDSIESAIEAVREAWPCSTAS